MYFSSHSSSSILERKEGKKLSFFSSPAVCHKASDRQIKEGRKQMDGWRRKPVRSGKQFQWNQDSWLQRKKLFPFFLSPHVPLFPSLPFFRKLKLTPTLGSELLSLSNCSWHDFKKAQRFGRNHREGERNQDCLEQMLLSTQTERTEGRKQSEREEEKCFRWWWHEKSIKLLISLFLPLFLDHHHHSSPNIFSPFLFPKLSSLLRYSSSLILFHAIIIRNLFHNDYSHALPSLTPFFFSLSFPFPLSEL